MNQTDKTLEALIAANLKLQAAEQRAAKQAVNQAKVRAAARAASPAGLVALFPGLKAARK